MRKKRDLHVRNAGRLRDGRNGSIDPERRARIDENLILVDNVLNILKSGESRDRSEDDGREDSEIKS